MATSVISDSEAPMGSPPPAVRRDRILDLLRREGSISLTEVARAFAVSPVTAHRDLERLAAEGLLERVHGGARLAGEPAPAPEPATTHRMLAAAAARGLEPGSTAFVGAGPAALALAHHLAAHGPAGLTLVTNAPAVAHLVRAPGLHLVACPGELDQDLGALTGRWTVDFLASLRFDVVFVVPDGVTADRGLTTARRAIADVVEVLRERTRRTVAVAEGRAIGHDALLPVARADAVDLIVTDPGAPADAAERLRQAGAPLHVVIPKERA